MPFIFSPIAGNRRHFKFGMWVEHSKQVPYYRWYTVPEIGVVTSRDLF